jgi:hypothetical protein
VWIKPWDDGKREDLISSDALTVAMVDRTRYLQKQVSPKSLAVFLAENKYTTLPSEAAEYVQNPVSVHFDASSTKKINVIASYLLLDRSTGAPSVIVRGRALVTHPQLADDVTSDEVGGIMFMVHNMVGVLSRPTPEGAANYVSATPVQSTEDRLDYMKESLMTDKADLNAIRENLAKQQMEKI